ncbi:MULTISPECIES: ornithine cyclodeaminase family protein [Brucella/Ochrobactrum group]|uniref:ornithine cyclodeaminase family protein n=1 Tax=Brucella/Ochrobactrum group TaxID=2826938 RepID=UPI001C053BFE|nr:ornithine cyclodeaminase family protein [Brucella sp. NBRC 12950]QWK81173.1 ornithine cyclodeaminase family protein [Ochrobactrum sp. BTU1]
MVSASTMNISFEDASSLLPLPQLIEQLRKAFIAGCVAPQRHHHKISVQDQPDATLLLMPSWQTNAADGGYLGVKVVTVFPGNTSRGIPGLTSSYLLFDGGTGVQLATIDGNAITTRRTVAVSALAASFLARKDAENLLVLGSGRVASLLPEAYSAVRKIRRVGIWDINLESADVMAKRLQAVGFDAYVASKLEHSVRDADIVTSATLATTPIIKGEWLKQGAHVDLIGGFTPTMREADDETLERSSVYVDTEAALHEAGDFTQAIESGAFVASTLAGSLRELCTEGVCGRSAPEQITTFKAVGTALADLAAATMAYETARSFRTCV